MRFVREVEGTVPPQVTIAIPTFNGAKLLGLTLDSLLAQSHRDFEVLLVDDCSTDGTHQYALSRARQDSRLRVFRTPTNLGTASRALNHVLPEVRGEYFVYSSQDDLFSPDWLQKLVARALETNADAVLPDVAFLRDELTPPTRLAGLDGNRKALLPGRVAVQLSMDWTIPGFALWRTAIVKRNTFATFGMNADEYSTRLFFLQCRLVAFCDGTFYYRQNNPDAITKKLSRGLFDIPGTHLRLSLFLRENGFPPSLVSQELLRCVSSLLWMKQRLELAGASLTPSDREAAMARLRATFDGIQPQLQFIDRTQRRQAQARIKLQLVSRGYRLFDVATRAAAMVRARIGSRS